MPKKPCIGTLMNIQHAKWSETLLTPTRQYFRYIF